MWFYGGPLRSQGSEMHHRVLYSKLDRDLTAAYAERLAAFTYPRPGRSGKDWSLAGGLCFGFGAVITLNLTESSPSIWTFLKPCSTVFILLDYDRCCLTPDLALKSNLGSSFHQENETMVILLGPRNGSVMQINSMLLLNNHASHP